MGFMDLFRKKAPQKAEREPRQYPADWPDPLKMAQAMQHFQLLQDSVDIISKTVYCKTFFYRYDFAVQNAQLVLELSKGCRNEQAAREMYDLLVNEKANIVNDFLFRCYDAGKIQDVKKDIAPYMKDVPGESRALLKAMVELKSLEHVDARPNVPVCLRCLWAQR